MLKFLKKKKTIQLPTAEKLSNEYDIIVHIGAPKAGSSAIQKYLLENRSKLLEMGFYYPEHGLDENGISGGHSNIGKNLKDGDFATAKAIMHTHINEANKLNCILLISAESLFNRAEELKKMTEEYRCKVIAFFRDPLESLYSNYNQGIKRNYLTTRLEAFCQNLLDKPADSLSGKIFDQWENVFGKSNLMILKYDLDVFSQTPIQSVFLNTIGIDKSMQKHSFTFDMHFVNNSYSLAALELKRMINFIINKENTRQNNELDWFLQGVSDRKGSKKYQLAERISSKTYTSLKKKLASSSQKIRETYLLDLNNNSMNEPNPSDLRTINQQQLAIEMADILILLKQQKPNIYFYIKEELESSLEKNSHHYEVIKLAEMFNYDLNQLQEREKWFNQTQLKKMPSLQLVDFYRDIAYLCYHRGDLENAKLLIEQAREIRPKGPTIVKLSELLKKLTP